MGVARKLILALLKVLQFSSYEWNKKIKPHGNAMKYYELECDIRYPKFMRLPSQIAAKSAKGINVNSRYSAGIKLAFKTDAIKIHFRVLYRKKTLLGHMSRNASSGIDVYVNYGSKLEWMECFAPSNNISMVVEKSMEFCEGDKVIEVYLPPFSQIELLEIGIDKKKYFKQIPVSYENAILVYGSSVSQGCAASRPSLSYVNLISRKTSKSIINMGFSESAKGDVEIIKYISAMHPSVFIMEYDHNASVEELKKTHLQVYSIFRKNNPECLIIMMTRFSGGLSISLEEEKERLKIIEDTYIYAVSNGDKNVEIIFGNKIITEDKENYFVDDRHPNDRGMICIAEAVCAVLQERGFYE